MIVATTLQLTTIPITVVLLVPVLRLRQFQGQGKRHLDMLNHVVEAEVLDQVVSGMDMVVTIIERAFNDKGTGIAGFGGTGMV